MCAPAAQTDDIADPVLLDSRQDVLYDRCPVGTKILGAVVRRDQGMDCIGVREGFDNEVRIAQIANGCLGPAGLEGFQPGSVPPHDTDLLYP